MRYALVLGPKWAFKVNGTYLRGYDWIARDPTDINPKGNATTGLLGADNPARDPVSSYGNESSNRSTLTLGGKAYQVARTGYREQDVVAEVRKVAPEGVQAIVEVSGATNAAIDAQVIGMHGAVAMYADDGGAEITVPVRAQMGPNARWQFVLVYTEPERAKVLAIEDVATAVADGAVRVGEDAGLPLHVFPLAETAAAHQAVQDGAVGKVLVDVTA